jgi:hypothetical protein
MGILDCYYEVRHGLMSSTANFSVIVEQQPLVLKCLKRKKIIYNIHFFHGSCIHLVMKTDPKSVHCRKVVRSVNEPSRNG